MLSSSCDGVGGGPDGAVREKRAPELGQLGQPSGAGHRHERHSASDRLQPRDAERLGARGHQEYVDAVEPGHNIVLLPGELDDVLDAQATSVLGQHRKLTATPHHEAGARDPPAPQLRDDVDQEVHPLLRFEPTHHADDAGTLVASRNRAWKDRQRIRDHGHPVRRHPARLEEGRHPP